MDARVRTLVGSGIAGVPQPECAFWVWLVRSVQFVAREEVGSCGVRILRGGAVWSSLRDKASQPRPLCGMK